RYGDVFGIARIEAGKNTIRRSSQATNIQIFLYSNITRPFSPQLNCIGMVARRRMKIGENISLHHDIDRRSHLNAVASHLMKTIIADDGAARARNAYADV